MLPIASHQPKQRRPFEGWREERLGTENEVYLIAAGDDELEQQVSEVNYPILP